MNGFEKLGREYLRDLLGEEPVYPVTHPRGPRGIEQLDHAPWLERHVFEEEQPPGRCILRRSCGRSCYCARHGAQAIVEEMRRRRGPWWPAEPPMPVGPVRYSEQVEHEQWVRRYNKQQGRSTRALEALSPAVLEGLAPGNRSPAIDAAVADFVARVQGVLDGRQS